jgi:CRP/FNR family cyclic AMP-dependent transcriptional regulator
MEKLIDKPYSADLLNNIPVDIKNRSVMIKFSKNDIVLKKDEEIKYVYILCSGTLRAINEFSNGNIYGFANINPPDFIGSLEILAEESKIACTVESVTDSTALRISKKDFLDWFERDVYFSSTLAKTLAKKFYPTIYRNGAVFMNSAMYSLVGFILQSIEDDIKQGRIGVIRKKRQHIADELGISLRTVYRVIKELKGDNLIQVIKGEIHVTKDQYERLNYIIENLK